MGFAGRAAAPEVDGNRQTLPEARPGRATARAAANEHLGAPDARATESGPPAIQNDQAASTRPAPASPAKVAGIPAAAAGETARADEPWCGAPPTVRGAHQSVRGASTTARSAPTAVGDARQQAVGQAPTVP